MVRFNANTDTYFRGADMAEPRWYPTATVMPDGKVLVYAGDRIVQNRPGAPHALEDASVNSLPELYNPANNTWTSLTSGQRTTPLYPLLKAKGARFGTRSGWERAVFFDPEGLVVEPALTLRRTDLLALSPRIA